MRGIVSPAAGGLRARCCGISWDYWHEHMRTRGSTRPPQRNCGASGHAGPDPPLAPLPPTRSGVPERNAPSHTFQRKIKPCQTKVVTSGARAIDHPSTASERICSAPRVLREARTPALALLERRLREWSSVWLGFLHQTRGAPELAAGGSNAGANQGSHEPNKPTTPQPGSGIRRQRR